MSRHGTSAGGLDSFSPSLSLSPLTRASWRSTRVKVAGRSESGTRVSEGIAIEALFFLSAAWAQSPESSSSSLTATLAARVRVESAKCQTVASVIGTKGRELRMPFPLYEERRSDAPVPLLLLLLRSTLS